MASRVGMAVLKVNPKGFQILENIRDRIWALGALRSENPLIDLVTLFAQPDVQRWLSWRADEAAIQKIMRL